MQTKSPEPAERPVLPEQPLQNAADIHEQQPAFRQMDVPPEPVAAGAAASLPEYNENQPRFFEPEQSSRNDSTDSADSFNGDSIESDGETSESDSADNGLFDIF